MTTTINASTSSGAVITSDTSGVIAIQNNGTTAMTLTGGNVGIGTTSPSSKLVVQAATDQGVWVTDGTYTGTFNPTSLGGIAVGTNGAYPLIFATNTSERMRINNAGDIYMNTTTRFGAGKVNIAYAQNSYWGMEINDTTAASGAYAIAFGSGGNRVGQISTTSSATTYATSSDYRLKENIAPMVGALDKVAQLKPCTYTWKADGSNGQGFIAHELQAVIPDAVTGEKDKVDEDGKPHYQGVDTSFLVATLTAAIQELKTELDATKAEVAALKGTL